MADGETKKTCFIAMPMTVRDPEKYGGDREHWKHVMEELFVPSVEAAGFVAIRPDAKGSTLIHANIVQNLQDADMVLCDLSSENANVMFELGVRTSVNKPVTLVHDGDLERLPFDVNGVNALTYNPGNKEWWGTANKINELKQHILDSERECRGKNPLWEKFGVNLAAEVLEGGSPEDAKLALIRDDIEALRRTTEAALRDRNYTSLRDRPQLDPTLTLLATPSILAAAQGVMNFLEKDHHFAAVEVLLAGEDVLSVKIPGVRTLAASLAEDAEKIAGDYGIKILWRDGRKASPPES